MVAEGTATVKLSDKHLAEIPEEVLLKCDTVGVLDLSQNLGIRLHGVLSRFKNVRKLVLNRCDLFSLPTDISDITQLEELVLSWNNFFDGLNPTVGRLRALKKLDLNHCELQSVPDWLGDLEVLEELVLWGNNLSEGHYSAVRRLRTLKKLDLRNCELQNLPDWLGDLQVLEELVLSRNHFSNGLPRCTRLRTLKKLDLSHCQMQSVPDWLEDLEGLEELVLSWNKLSEGVNSTIGGLRTLKKLDLNHCDLHGVPDWLGDLEVLEELVLWGNNLSKGLNPSVRRLRKLKKLDLSHCELPTVPDWLGDLVDLEELVLWINHFSAGLNPAVGRLRTLKKLHLSNCKLHSVPDWLGDMAMLEELVLSWNYFSEGLNPTVGRLQRLKKLDLRDCKLRDLPDGIGDLVVLEELLLYGNSFSEGLNPAVRQLRTLQKLELSHCQLKSVPDWLGDLKLLRFLTLTNNYLEEYPPCLLRLKHLEVLDVSNDSWRYGESKSEGNCIRQLPVELAFTSLRELHLEGNPITEPPDAIWTQGLDAIKSYMRALIPGGEMMRADTINMIGDTGAGKTSIAQSLVARSPRPTASCDRTRVMQQLRMRIDETTGQSVNINDFGGHEIYHSVVPIFLPANGLLILVFDVTNRIQLQSAKKWLLTAIAKSREIRIILAGTHADKLSNVGERLTSEQQILALSSNIFRTAIDEVNSHICHIESRPNDINMQDKLKTLYQLQSNLRSATVRVVTLSCSVPDTGLLILRDLAVELLLRPATLPVRWCHVIHNILKLSPAGFYIQMSQAQEIARAHFTEEDDHQALTTILRYLAKTSLIIWIEDHPRLQDFIFHSPQKIIDLCKEILHHDSQSFPTHFKSNWEEYDSGIVREPLLRQLLKMHTVNLDRGQEQSTAIALPFEVAVDFLQHFNLISNVAMNSECRRFIVPCKLKSDEPSELMTFKQTAESCLNKVSMRLSFIGSVVPISFFETCLAAMLAVAGQLFYPVVHPWRSGLIVIYGGVHFLVKLCDDGICLTAFSEPPVASPWTILQPMLRRLNENAVVWSGAPPSCAIECPWCVRRYQCEYAKRVVGEIETDLRTLVQLEQQNEAGPTCPKCFKLIPRSLCFPTASKPGSFTEDQKEITKFFENNAFADCQEHRKATGSRDLAKKLAQARPLLVRQLDTISIECIVDELIAARDGHGLITEEERQLIRAEQTSQGKARRLLDAVSMRGSDAIRILAATLLSSSCARPDLAKLFHQ